jgi:hypothetical protein
MTLSNGLAMSGKGGQTLTSNGNFQSNQSLPTEGALHLTRAGKSRAARRNYGRDHVLDGWPPKLASAPRQRVANKSWQRMRNGI